MDETLLEDADSRGVSLAVEREKGVVRGVKILGLASRNGRTYPAATLARAANFERRGRTNRAGDLGVRERLRPGGGDRGGRRVAIRRGGARFG